MRIQLSDHFTFMRLIKFVFPSVMMMLFTSIYGVIDGLFVSNFAGKTPFAAINLIMPLLMGLGTIGFMIGTGGSAIVSKTLGKGDRNKANRYFSALVWSTIIIGLLLTIPGLIWLRPIAAALGAEEQMMNDCIIYGSILLSFQTAFMLQNVFQSFFITAEKPTLGLGITVTAGCTNIVLDALFVAVFHWGTAGAAAATVISQCVGGILPLFYFARKNDSLLQIVKPAFELNMLIKVCTNGSSELMTNLSLSLVNILYNFQLIKMAGENGIAAYGVIMYVNFIFLAVFIGYSIGIAPVIGFHYGEENHNELKNLLRKSMVLIGAAGIFLTCFAELLAKPLSLIFVSYDKTLLIMTCRGFQIYSISFLITGFNIFGSAFFTALNNGFVSAAISFLRTLLFQVICILFLPVLWGIDGIWLAITFAEISAAAVTFFFLVNKRKVYSYN
ncbi:polysaccharide biosynthesis C-terminal domain-containing protein [Oscillospiraceae bacterium DSM 107454]|uniref:Polysaccharide biosynthesis C-terminal domain-containing protein n=2 Tax=Ructibacterium gallinarum TaxID=2779355 RepID=A0A9D5R8M6_9FIRM|nr:MATE family efflux transporter [Ructibacterium gallinarum]MBE5040150.1 polysaccharide biosynthesis C-terminal domain-containing protein [Ructibacterium gallinarum]